MQLFSNHFWTILNHKKAGAMLASLSHKNNDGLLASNNSSFKDQVSSCNYDAVLHEELAMALSLNTDTRCETVFQEVKTYFQKNQIPLTNVIAYATDGAPSTIGCYRGFIALLKGLNLLVLTVYSVIHGQHLVTKNMSVCLNIFLKTVIKAVNKIKAHALNTRLFKQLRNQNHGAFERLLLQIKVRWLFKGNCLARFYSLVVTVMEFLPICDSGLAKEVIAVRNDIAYLSDIFSRFNEQNIF